MSDVSAAFSFKFKYSANRVINISLYLRRKLDEMSNKNLVFNAAVRGFHVYKTNWKPQDIELLTCTHEEDNPYDTFSMKVCKPDFDEIVRHLPMEISRIIKFIADRGAKCTLKIRGMHYRRSPLVQGGLKFLVR